MQVNFHSYIFYLILNISLVLTIAGCNTNNNDIFKFKNSLFEKTENVVNKKQIRNTNLIVNYRDFNSNNANLNIKKAILNHPAYQKKISSLEIAKSNTELVKSSKNLQVNFGVLGGLARQDEQNEIGLSGSVNFIKLLHDYGATDQAIKAEKEKIKAAEFEIKNQAENLGFIGFQNWINLFTEREILKIYKNGINRAAPLVEKIDQISLSGIADSTLILRARKEYSEMVVRMKQAEVVEKNAEINFLNFFNPKSFTKVGKLKVPVIVSYNSHEAKMIKNSPILKGQNALLKSLKISKESLIAQKNPNISFRAGINAPAENPAKNGSANVGFSLNYIYDDGGKLDAQIDTAENQIQFSKIDYDNYLKNLKLELATSHKAYIGAKETKQNLLELIKLSEDVRNNLNDQLAIGRAKLQDVLSAEVNLANNRILLINTERELFINSYKIKYLSDGLFPRNKWH